MKIVKETLSQLRLQDQSKFNAWTAWIFGTISMLLGLDLLVASILLSIYPRSLTCQRLTPTQGNCEIVRLGGIFPPEVISINIPLGDLQGAKVEESTDSDSDSSQVILSVTSGDISFAGISTNWNYEQKVENVNKINQFVKTSDQNTLVIKERDIGLSLFIFPFALVPLLLGFGLMVGKVNSYTFDKDLSKLILKKQNGLGADITEHHLSDIADVRLDVGELDSDNERLYKALILLKSGAPLIILQGYNEEKNGKKIVDRIRRFLNLKSLQ